jgi:hypothetical protein
VSATPGLRPTAFELTADDEGRVASILCRGTLRADSAGRLRDAIDSALERPRVLLCLDLEEVIRVDRPGIEPVIGIIERCAAEGVHLELWPGSAVEQMLERMHVALPRRAYPARPSALFAAYD